MIESEHSLLYCMLWYVYCRIISTFLLLCFDKVRYDKFFFCSNNCSPIHCVCITSFSQLFITTSMTTYSFHNKTPKTSQIFKIFL